jgi:folate-dependent phosphoribosylglycinamide formyltransferase PurN
MASIPRKRVALALSGGGRTLKNLIAQEHTRAYHIAGVISSREDCPGVEIAHELGLPVFVGTFGKSAAPTLVEDLHQWLRDEEIDWIALGGFLKPFPSIPGYENRVINIHPALLPQYGGKGMYGMHVHRAVHANKETVTGASIHFVNEHYDEGSIIAQIRVPITGLADPEAIASKVFSSECRLYPEVLDRLCRGSLPLADGTIFTMEA